MTFTPISKTEFDPDIMKSTIWKTLAAAITAIGLFALQTTSADAAVTVTGATLVWAADATDDPNSFADTIGGNDRWNIYVRPEGATDFLNIDDGADTRFAATVEFGESATWELYVNSASWADGAVANPGTYLNLFIGDRNSPAISARLTGGNTGIVAPLTSDIVSLVPNDADGALVAPAGNEFNSQLGSVFYAAGNGEFLHLTTMSFEVVGDTVSAFKDLPDLQGAGAPDTKITIGVEVNAIPEPSTGLLALLGAGLFLLRRR